MSTLSLPPKVEFPSEPRSMVQVRYCGPISRLKGHTALAVRLKDKPTKLAVQFDDHCLCLRATMMDEVSMVTLGTAGMDKTVSSITHTEIWLAYGWHEFDAFDFLPVTGEL